MSDSFSNMTLHLALHNGRIMQKPATVHLDANHLAAFLDDRLTPAEHERAVAHFAVCTECRHELSAVRDVLQTVPRGRPGWWLAGGAVLAAALAFVLVVPRIRGNESAESLPPIGVRGIDESPPISIRGPVDGTIVGLPLMLTWGSAGADAFYRVYVQDTRGTELLRETTSDTSYVVPDSVRLARGARYFWSVEAILANGRSSKSSATSFSVK